MPAGSHFKMSKLVLQITPSKHRHLQYTRTNTYTHMANYRDDVFITLWLLKLKEKPSRGDLKRALVFCLPWISYIVVIAFTPTPPCKGDENNAILPHHLTSCILKTLCMMIFANFLHRYCRRLYTLLAPTRWLRDFKLVGYTVDVERCLCST